MSSVSNYGKVVVYIQDFSQTSVSETPAYEASFYGKKKILKKHMHIMILFKSVLINYTFLDHYMIDEKQAFLLNIHKIYQLQAQQLSSDIGGVLGLYIGCSILSIVEFLELFLDVTFLGIYHTVTNTCQCQKNYSRKKNQNRLNGSQYDRKIFPQPLKSNWKSEHSKKALVDGLNIGDELEVTSKPRMGSFTGMSSFRQKSKRMPVVF